MKRAERLAGIWMILGATLAATGVSQEANVTNARLQTRAVDGGLEEPFRKLARDQIGPAWIGYAVPVVEGQHRICCYPAEEHHKPALLRHGQCKLESRDEGMNFQSDGDSDQETSSRLLVLFRVADKTVGKIRVFTGDCELDAGGLPVWWLTDVNPKESIRLLASFVRADAEKSRTQSRISETAVTAIALHADPAADSALEAFVDPRNPEEVRKNTAFWLGNVRGQKGYEILRRMVHDDPSEKVRDQCIFALHLSKVPEAVNTIIEMARKDKSSHLRGQALFWLSQKAGQKAANAISDAIENDPETEVKKKAVFALSQLPREQGIPKLIQVARVNHNREVRKDAMFWLGQSNDERALTFFEEVLTR